MKLIIAGSRTITNPELLEKAMIASKFAQEELEEIISGGAKGVDTLGELWATKHNVPIKRFPADWDKHGKGAGPIRNKKMAEYVGASGGLLALWDGASPGTNHMMFVAKSLGLRVKVYKPKSKGK